MAAINYNQNNGQIIMEALHKLNKPSNFGQIVHYIVDNYENNDKETIKPTVRKVLRKGVANGFIWKNKRKYGTYSVFSEMKDKQNTKIRDELFALYVQ